MSEAALEHITAGSRPGHRRGSGRPPKRPWLSFHVTGTLLAIEAWRRVAGELALGDRLDEPAFRRLMTRHRVLPEFWDEMRGVMGRQRRYRPVLGLTPRGHQAVRVLTARLDALPPKQETEADKRHAKDLLRLWERQHGRRTARQIDLSRMRGEPAFSLAASDPPPRRLMGLDGALDAWGAAKHRTTVKTLQKWRRLAIAADAQRPEGERRLARFQRPEQPPAKRHLPS